MCSINPLEQLVKDKGLTASDIMKYYNDLGVDLFKHEKMGVIQEEYRDEYIKYYELCKNINGVTKFNGLSQQKTTELKGLALEKLVGILFEGTGRYYKVHTNLRTSSNEIDILVKLSDKGKDSKNMIDSKYHKLICECKNHSVGLKVDYVGKFYSLVRYTHLNFAIIFSWNGLAGKKTWNNSSGLVKKIFLITDAERRPVYILDFNKINFKEILDGKNLFSIFDEKCMELEMDIDLEKEIKQHENEVKIQDIINKMVN